jgi:hypothetical protein
VKSIWVLIFVSLFAGAQTLTEKPVESPLPDQAVGADQAKKISRLFLVSDIDLIGFSWSDLALEKEARFSNPLISSWVKSLQPQLSGEVKEILPCVDECSEAFYQWLQIPQEAKMDVPESYVNSLWLKVSYKLRKINHDPSINEWSFEWEGSAVLLDANLKESIATRTIETEKRTWRGLDQKTLNSVLASSMYKTALDHLHHATISLKNLERPDRLTRIIVKGQRNVSDLFNLIELLKKEGASMKLNAKLDVFGPKEAQILCFYKGEEKSFTDLLSRLKELKSTRSYGLVNEISGIHHVLKLVAP